MNRQTLACGGEVLSLDANVERVDVAHGSVLANAAHFTLHLLVKHANDGGGLCCVQIQDCPLRSRVHHEIHLHLQLNCIRWRYAVDLRGHINVGDLHGDRHGIGSGDVVFLDLLR